MKNKLNKIISMLTFISIFICIFFIPTISITEKVSGTKLDENLIYFYGNTNFAWPVPGYTRISSYFGKRTAPTSGASIYHKGLDIPAPEGTVLIATCNGEITFTGFLGGGGYTITLTSTDGIKISYCHVSPYYLVSKGDLITQGQVIGTVRSKIRIWSSTETLIKMNQDFLQMEQQQVVTYI